MKLRSMRVGVLVLVLVGPFGCGSAEPPPRLTVQATRPVSTEPGQVELSAPVVTLIDPEQAKFEVQYRFTAGQPDKYYMLEIRFPGTKNAASKLIESWELKAEGTIRDTAFIREGPVTSFEIVLSEAVTPMAGFKPISNVVTGQAQPQSIMPE